MLAAHTKVPNTHIREETEPRTAAPALLPPPGVCTNSNASACRRAPSGDAISSSCCIRQALPNVHFRRELDAVFATLNSTSCVRQIRGIAVVQTHPFCTHAHTKHTHANSRIRRVSQNHICAPYMIVHWAIPLPKTPYIHRIYGSGQP